jgi:hypothetical protein
MLDQTEGTEAAYVEPELDQDEAAEEANGDDGLGVWEFTRESNVADMAQLIEADLYPADFHVRFVANTADTITAQVIGGVAPVAPDGALYVKGRGAYEVLGSSFWPGGLAMLTLAAWPRR